MTKTKPYKIISLFSGCGGLDLGLEGGFKYLGKKYKKNPLRIIWANDINEKATKTQRLNFPHTEVVCADIMELLGVGDDGTYKTPSPLKLPKADVVIGGFPCQDFSPSGKRLGLTTKRGKLYRGMVKVIETVQPKVFLAENVKGLLSWGDGIGIKTIVKEFSELGYKVEYKLLNAADFGVPQVRERVIIIGVRSDLKSKIKWPKPTHSAVGGKLKTWVTIEEAVGDLEDEEKQKQLPNYGFSKAKFLPGLQGNAKTKANKPSPTMRAEHHGNIEFHYKLDRRLSAREAARIQTFPDDFTFVSSVTDTYRQVGNAVAPVFSWHLAQTLLGVLNENKDVVK
jgi:DNA (cytosine-5)-methyltransferase 1